MLQIWELSAEQLRKIGYAEGARNKPGSRVPKRHRQSRIKQLALFAQQDLIAIDYRDEVLRAIHSTLGADMASLTEKFSHQPGFGFCAFQAKDITIHTVEAREAERKKLTAMTTEAVQKGATARLKACWYDDDWDIQ